MITVNIKDGFMPQHHFGKPYYQGQLHSIEDSGCWVLLPDQTTNVAFCTDELLLPKSTTKNELLALVNADCEQPYAKELVTALLRHRCKH